MKNKFNNEECPICYKKLQWKEKESIGCVEFYTIGSFCKNCNKWILTTSISKLERDDTLYHIILLEKESLNKEQFNFIGKVINKSIEEIKDLLKNTTPILFEGKAIEIEQKIKVLDEIKIKYKIAPPFPFQNMDIEDTFDIDDIMKLIEENDNINLDKRQYSLILEKSNYLDIQQVKTILKYSNELFQDDKDLDKQNENILFQESALDILENAYWLDRNKITYKILPAFPYQALLDNGRKIAEKNKRLEEILEGKQYNWKKIYDNSKILITKS